MKPETIKAKEKTTGVSLFRTLVVSFSLVAALSCVLIGLLSYYLRADGMRTEQYRLLETIRDENVQGMSTWFSERTGDLSVMVSRPDIVRFCQTHASDEANAHQEVLTALVTLRSAYRYEAVFLADAKGRTFASTETEFIAPGSLPLREAAVQTAIREKRNVVSDVLISKIHSKPTLFLFTPVFSPKTTEVIGVLGILLDPSLAIYPQYAQSQHLGQTGEILLVNRDGLVQSPLKHREGAIASVAIHAKPAGRGAAGEFGIIATEDYRAEHVMAAYGHITEFDWGIVVKQDMVEINAPVESMARSVMSASAGALFLALIAGFIIARGISLSARHIAEAAVLIGEGDSNVRVPTGLRSPDGRNGQVRVVPRHRP